MSIYLRPKSIETSWMDAIRNTVDKDMATAGEWLMDSCVRIGYSPWGFLYAETSILNNVTQ